MEDYEKKYKEALSRAASILKVAANEKEAIDYVSTIFPELKESEDERVKKRILLSLEKDLMATKNSGCDTQDLKQCIAWLEKQGEQKPIMNVPTREVILSIWDLGNEWKELTNGSISTEYGTQLDYIQKHWYESEYYLREKQGDQKPAEQNGDNRKLYDTVIEELSKYSGNEVYKAPWALDSTGVQYPLYFAELGVKWQKEQKPAWSDEDEKMYKIALSCIETLEDISNGKNMHADVKDWLKSLKDRIGG